MAFSRSSRIMTLLVIDSLFFFLEIIVGYMTHSLALVADSFHMLNDVLSLVVALWAIKLARQKSSVHYTYGWQRAEVLGALVNGVFLLALCFSIFLEAIQRIFEPATIGQPALVLGVGAAGFASNILGLLLFHEHGHGHGHGHGHDHGHDHGDAEAGLQGGKQKNKGPSEESSLDSEDGDIESVLPETVVRRVSRSVSPLRNFSQRTPSTSRRSSDRSRPRHFASPVTDIHVHPARNRQEVIAAAVSDGDYSSYDDTDTESSPLLDHGRPSHNAHAHEESAHHQGEKKSHQSLNMRGVFLHVLGDALGNAGVMITAVIIRWARNRNLAAHPGDPSPPPSFLEKYADPCVSLVITLIILCSAIPLCKSASKILLQGVPKGIALEDVKNDIAKVSGVESVHELHIWQLSDVKMIASLHIQIAFDPEARGGGRYMELANEIRHCLHAYGIHSSTIQPEYTRPMENGMTVGEGSRPSTVVGEYGAMASAKPSRAGSFTGSDTCLLECGDDCEDGKCCAPVPEGEGHGH